METLMDIFKEKIKHRRDLLNLAEKNKRYEKCIQLDAQIFELENLCAETERLKRAAVFECN